MRRRRVVSIPPLSRLVASSVRAHGFLAGAARPHVQRYFAMGAVDAPARQLPICVIFFTVLYI